MRRFQKIKTVKPTKNPGKCILTSFFKDELFPHKNVEFEDLPLTERPLKITDYHLHWIKNHVFSKQNVPPIKSFVTSICPRNKSAHCRKIWAKNRWNYFWSIYAIEKMADRSIHVKKFWGKRKRKIMKHMKSNNFQTCLGRKNYKSVIIRFKFCCGKASHRSWSSKGKSNSLFFNPSESEKHYLA